MIFYELLDKIQNSSSQISTRVISSNSRFNTFASCQAAWQHFSIRCGEVEIRCRRLKMQASTIFVVCKTTDRLLPLGLLTERVNATWGRPVASHSILVDFSACSKSAEIRLRRWSLRSEHIQPTCRETVDISV